VANSVRKAKAASRCVPPLSPCFLCLHSPNHRRSEAAAAAAAAAWHQPVKCLPLSTSLLQAAVSAYSPQATSPSSGHGKRGCHRESAPRVRRKGKKKAAGPGEQICFHTTSPSKLERCLWCAGQVTSIPLSIPQDAGRSGVGVFCSWECAKAWNNRHSPVQARYLRSLFIDDAAGTWVLPSHLEEGEKGGLGKAIAVKVR
jgi:hypothetical protein